MVFITVTIDKDPPLQNMMQITKFQRLSLLSCMLDNVFQFGFLYQMKYAQFLIFICC